MERGMDRISLPRPAGRHRLVLLLADGDSIPSMHGCTCNAGVLADGVTAGIRSDGNIYNTNVNNIIYQIIKSVP